MRLAPVIVLTAALGFGLACGDSTGTVAECTGPVTVTAGTGGTMPTFQWSPACRLFEVAVEDSLHALLWFTRSSSANRIAPPVTYGTAPQGADHTTSPPETLQSGRSYRAEVVLYISDDSAPVIGNASFRP